MKAKFFIILLLSILSHHNYPMQMMIQMPNQDVLKQRLINSELAYFSHATNIIELVANKIIPISDLFNIVDQELNKHFDDLNKSASLGRLKTHSVSSLQEKKSSLLAALYANHPSDFIFSDLDI